MALLELVLVGSALALDAFAVSVASGVVIKERKVAHAIRVALFFGGFQAIMPLIGWLAGAGLRESLAGIDHWIAFGLLTLIGGKMICEASKLRPEERIVRAFGALTLFVLAVATSLDALAVGFSLGVRSAAIVAPVVAIGVITFVASLLGVWIGDRVGHMFESKIEVVGGLVLIGIGVKIVLEHLL